MTKCRLDFRLALIQKAIMKTNIKLNGRHSFFIGRIRKVEFSQGWIAPSCDFPPIFGLTRDAPSNLPRSLQDWKVDKQSWVG